MIIANPPTQNPRKNIKIVKNNSPNNNANNNVENDEHNNVINNDNNNEYQINLFRDMKIFKTT